MIGITDGASTHFCNACTNKAAVDVSFQKAGKPFSSSVSLCEDCLAELAAVSRQAVAARSALADSDGLEHGGE